MCAHSAQMCYVCRKECVRPAAGMFLMKMIEQLCAEADARDFTSPEPRVSLNSNLGFCVEQERGQTSFHLDKCLTV